MADWFCALLCPLSHASECTGTEATASPCAAVTTCSTVKESSAVRSPSLNTTTLRSSRLEPLATSMACSIPS